MKTQLLSIATALIALCALPSAMAGAEELSFSPTRINISRALDGAHRATFEGEIKVPEGLLFQPAASSSNIPVQDKARSDALVCILYKSAPSRLITLAQQLSQSSTANNCTLEATLTNYWLHHETRARYRLNIEVDKIPQGGEIKIAEQVPFILAQDVTYSEQMPINPEQISLLKESEEDSWVVKRCRIKLGITADQDFYSYQFFNADGQQMQVHICQLEKNAAGDLELEGEFLSTPPSSFRSVKLRDARPITLKLKGTLKLPAEQIDHAIQQSIGENSPYQSQWSNLFLALNPEIAKYARSNLNFSWSISGFEGNLPLGNFWSSTSRKPHILSQSSELNGSTTEMAQTAWPTGGKEFILTLPHPFSSKQLHFDETLDIKLFHDCEISELLALNAKQSTIHTVNGHEYTATAETLAELQGYRITGLKSNDSIVRISFLNAQGEVVNQCLSSCGGGREGVFFGFPNEQPAAFQIKYLTKPQKLSIPCRFTIPLPEWVDEQ